MKRNIFKNISPLDHRYSLNEKEFEKYSVYFSEEAVMRYQAKVELAIIEEFAKEGVCPQETVSEIKGAIEKISIEEIYKEEEKTKHNTRALINCIRRKVSEKTRQYIHLGVTSFDIIDTAASLRYKEATKNLILPLLLELEKELIRIALREKHTLQIGRTHGQHAEPITFGFAISEYVSRLGRSIENIKKTSNELKGKISGAVGAYNALSLFISDPIDFEKKVLSRLGLKPATHSTQIVEPEYLNDFIHAIITTFGVLANLSDDMRHLQRTEINEIGEYFTETQVGSSTMPHKHNPINYENVKSLWKEFMPRMFTIYMDQISEHQRDLTNSASSRFISEIIVGLLLSTNRLIRVLKKLTIEYKSLIKNFNISKDMIIAEPLYILLAYHGHPDAHEAVRKLTLKSQETKKKLLDLMLEDKELSPYYNLFTKTQKNLLKNPEIYVGKSVEKTEEVTRYWIEKLNITI